MRYKVIMDKYYDKMLKAFVEDLIMGKNTSSSSPRFKMMGLGHHPPHPAKGHSNESYGSQKVNENVSLFLFPKIMVLFSNLNFKIVFPSSVLQVILKIQLAYEVPGIVESPHC